MQTLKPWEVVAQICIGLIPLTVLWVAAYSAGQDRRAKEVMIEQLLREKAAAEQQLQRGKEDKEEADKRKMEPADK